MKEAEEREAWVYRALAMEPEAALATARSEATDEGFTSYAEAEVLYAAQRFRRAASELAKAYDVDPDPPLTRSLYAVLLGPRATREETLREVVDANPLLSRPKLFLALTLAATPGRLAEAREEFAACLDHRPHDLQALDGLSFTLGRVGDKQGAEEAAARLGEVSPTWRWTAQSMRRLLALHRYRRAAAVWRSAARRLPGWRVRVLPIVVPMQAYPAISFGVALIPVGMAVQTFPGAEAWFWSACAVGSLGLYQFAARNGGRFGAAIRYRSLQRFRAHIPA